MNTHKSKYIVKRRTKRDNNLRTPQNIFKNPMGNNRTKHNKSKSYLTNTPIKPENASKR